LGRLELEMLNVVQCVDFSDTLSRWLGIHS